MIVSAVVLLIELSVLFFGIALLVQLLKRRIGAERLRNWMGGRPLVSALKGIAIGFMTPFCTYSAVPMLVGMRQAGVSPAGYVAFIMAAPVLDPVLFGALVIIVGLKAAIVYFSVAFVAALSLALLAERVDISSQLKAIALDSQGTSDSSASGLDTIEFEKSNSACTENSCSQPLDQPWRGSRVEFHWAALEAFALLRSVALLLLIGVLIGIGITALISADTVANLTSHSKGFEIPIAAAIGTPIYTTTALLVPIADSLRGVGVSIGAIVALTIAGAGANLPEFFLLLRFFHTQIICIFFLYVFLVAVLGGYISQILVA